MVGQLPLSFLAEICRARSGFVLPRLAHQQAREFLFDLLAILYPHFTENVRCEESQLAEDFQNAHDVLAAWLSKTMPEGEAVAERFFRTLPEIKSLLDEDARFIDESDPASSGVDEVILAYPGFLGIAAYRLAHSLHCMGVPLLPRLIAETAHRETGIDIHPGAEIGSRFAIDHGTGIVIGGTAKIGHGVKIYQGVTLGALAVSKQLAEVKRHPTIEDNVVIYANATILGGNTVVGAGSVIGGNVWLTSSVPPNSRVTRSTPIISVEDPLEYYI